MKHIAILDVGKTNAKAILLDAMTGKEIAVQRIPNTVLHDGPYPHYDLETLWSFFLNSLCEFARETGFDAISITTHGASAVLLDKNGQVAMPMLDYEYEYSAEIRGAYARIKPEFGQTFSPTLPAGLNIGVQLHYLKTTFPEQFDEVALVVTYPQYWSYRLTGIAAVEVTSLGCHTDLWLPECRRYSSLVESLSLTNKFPPLRSAFDALDNLRPEIVNEIGLAAPVPIYCGIHDSNASLLTHLMGREPPFAVVSTGTWVVCFAVGGDLEGLDPNRDTLANVDAYGRAVPSARYMGGREFDIMTANLTTPSEEEHERVLDQVLARGIMALPSAVPGCGPYPDNKLHWLNAEDTSPEERYVASCLYAALMTQSCLELLGANGPIIVEGPFAANGTYLHALAGFAGRDVVTVSGMTGTAMGAALLAGAAVPARAERIFNPSNEKYKNYKIQWLGSIS